MVFPHHHSGAGDLAGTPHGTTPPMLVGARQQSLQDPLPVMQMTVRLAESTSECALYVRQPIIG